MEKDLLHFKFVADLMRSSNMWFDQPSTWTGTLNNLVNLSRHLTLIVLLISASSQFYYYGMSYVLNDSAVLVAMGFIACVMNISTALNFNAIVHSAIEFELLIDSFVEKWELDNIEKDMAVGEKLITLLAKLLNLYVVLTAITHYSSILIHYFFGFPSKPVLLPLLFEMYMEGDFQLRPFLFINVTISLLFIWACAAFIAYLAIAFYFMRSTTAILNVLTQRLQRISESAGLGFHMLTGEIDLQDTVGKHANLLNAVDGMMKWYGFLFAFLNVTCTLFFCINAITTKKALQASEYSSLCMWGSFLISMLVVMYMLCNEGQRIEEKSEELLYEMYNLPWYRGSSKSRRTVLNMLCQGNRLIKMSFKSLAHLNLATYSEILQTSYSYFTILTSVE